MSADGVVGQTGERPIELELGSARVAFSTRRGGVSEGPYESLNLGILTDDDPERVSRNRALLAERVRLDPAAIAMGWQVHGAELKEWERADGGFAGRPGQTTPDLDRVDAHATGARGLGLLVLVADCLPVALAAPGRVAMLHCGWRGLAAGIVERAAATFGEEHPVAVIGPGIGPCCYEVGDEVRERFRDVDDAARGRMLNLRAVARAKLRSAEATLAEDVDLCTSCRPDLFFSHRRDGGVTGRQCGLVWRT